MKKTILLLLILLLVQIGFSQDKNQLKEKIKDINTLQPNNNVLAWIKTSKDFPQADLTPEEIDNRINSIIQQQKDKSVIDIETPVNLKKVKYYGYIDVNKVGIIGNSTLLTDLKFSTHYVDALGTGGKNFFQYENIKILCTYNSFEDQLQVYSIIRAILILKNKYPEIYKDLFTATENSPELNGTLIKDIPQNKNTVLNTNKNYVFVVHENSTRLLSSTYSSISAEYTQNYPERLVSDNNTHLIFLNKNTLRNGGTAVGAKPIYTSVPDVASGHINYLFDGIVQTIVHERLHDYLTNQMTLNKFFDYVKNNQEFLKNLPSGKKSNYDSIEEPIVTNTTNRIFEKYGGISKEINSYYKELFDKTQIPKMKSDTNFDKLIPKLKELNSKAVSASYDDVLLIYF